MTTKQRFFSSALLLELISLLLDMLDVGQSDISFSSAARNLAVIFDSELALKEQVNKLSTGLSGDQKDQFNPTVSFCGSY